MLQSYTCMQYIVIHIIHIQPESPTRELTVLAASMHSLLRTTCNHNHKLLASASTKIKGSEFW